MAKKAKRSKKIDNAVETQETYETSTPEKQMTANWNINLFDAFIDPSDNELLQRIDQLETERQRLISNREDPTPAEVDKCFAQREWQLRRERFHAHKAYLDRENEPYENENDYPVADLDNWEFVSLYNKYNHDAKADRV